MTDTIMVDRLARLHPLATLDAEALDRLTAHCRVERVARNLDLFGLRDWTGQLIFLVKGELKLDLPDGGVSVLVGGTGEALHPLGPPRHPALASRAITDIELLCLSSGALDAALKERKAT